MLDTAEDWWSQTLNARISKTHAKNVHPPKIQIELEYISTHILIKIMSRQEDFDLIYNFFPEFAKNKISVYGHLE